jgi:hypothetical protein
VLALLRPRIDSDPIISLNVMLHIAATIFVLFAFLQLQAIAGETFTIIAVSGNPEFQILNSDSWKVCIKSQKLNEGSKIRLKKNGYAALWGSQGTMIEIRNPGETVLASNQQISGNATGKLQKYLSEEFLSASKKNNYAGSVSRAVKPDIEIVYPFETRVLDNQVEFRWKSAKPGQYTFQLLSVDKIEIIRTELKDTTFILDLATIPTLSKGECLYWSVRPNPLPPGENTTELHCLLPVRDADKRQLEQEFTEFLQSLHLSNQDSPLAYSAAGAWFEDRHIYNRAWLYYSKAASAGADIQDFKQILDEFLLRLSTGRR